MYRTIVLLVLLFPGIAHAEGFWSEAEVLCLVESIYHEARGETLKGQQLVATVIINRVRSSKYPNTICEVVKQPYQFSCFNRKLSIKDKKSWSKIYNRAKLFLEPINSKIMYYHNTSVSPNWASQKTKVLQAGNHIFYR